MQTRLPLVEALDDAADLFCKLSSYSWDWDAMAADCGNPVAAEAIADIPF